jgi:hypothetical protein
MKTEKQECHKRAVTMIIFVAIISFIVYSCARPLTPAEEASRIQDLKIETVKRSCRNYVSHFLLNPDSAEFNLGDDVSEDTGVDGIWAAKITVKTRNVFNAVIKYTFICRVELIDNRRATTLRAIRL